MYPNSEVASDLGLYYVPSVQNKDTWLIWVQMTPKCIFWQIWQRSGRVLDSRPKGCGLELHWRHCVVSLSKNINPSLVLVQPRKTRPFITERLLMGRKESN